MAAVHAKTIEILFLRARRLKTEWLYRCRRGVDIAFSPPHPQKIIPIVAVLNNRCSIMVLVCSAIDGRVCRLRMRGIPIHF